jgi:TPR repeat protein
MADVFISYRKADRAKAEALAKALKIENIDVWWDEGLAAGQTFDEKIQSVLEQAKAVVVVWSKESVKSEWVRAESSVGRERGILVPVMIQPVNIPVPFNLIHTADLIGWNGDRAHRGYQDVVKQVKTLAGKQHVKPLKPPPNAALRSLWRAIAAVAVLAAIGASTWVIQPWKYVTKEAIDARVATETRAKLVTGREKAAPYGVAVEDFDKLYAREIAVKKFKPETYEQLKAAAASGDVAALLVKCAVDTANYDGRNENPDLGFEDCEKAAASDDPLGHVYFAEHLDTMGLYNQRIDVDKAYMTATAEYKKAADVGNPWGAFYFGMRLYKGDGVEADANAAEAPLKAASAAGLPAGDFGLGTLYMSGKVVGPDEQAAEALIRKAADAGFDEAQFDLCDRLVGGGWSGETDLDGALRYCKAASTSATPYIAEKAKSWIPDVEKRIAERDAAKSAPAPAPAPQN